MNDPLAPSPHAGTSYMPPRCECHGEPMGWAKNRRLRAGGRWRCNVIHRETSRRRFRELMADPEKYAMWKERRNARRKAQRAAVREAAGIPIHRRLTNAEIRERDRARARARYERIRRNPELYDEYLARKRAEKQARTERRSPARAGGGAA